MTSSAMRQKLVMTATYPMLLLFFRNLMPRSFYETTKKTVRGPPTDAVYKFQEEFSFFGM